MLQAYAAVRLMSKMALAAPMVTPLVGEPFISTAKYYKACCNTTLRKKWRQNENTLIANHDQGVEVRVTFRAIEFQEELIQTD